MFERNSSPNALHSCWYANRLAKSHTRAKNFRNSNLLYKLILRAKYVLAPYSFLEDFLKIHFIFADKDMADKSDLRVEKIRNSYLHYKIILHVKYQVSAPCSFWEEEFTDDRSWMQDTRQCMTNTLPRYKLSGPSGQWS